MVYDSNNNLTIGEKRSIRLKKKYAEEGFPEERKIKISNTLKKYFAMNPDKIRRTYGLIPWNKGKTHESDPRIAFGWKHSDKTKKLLHDLNAGDNNPSKKESSRIKIGEYARNRPSEHNKKISLSAKERLRDPTKHPKWSGGKYRYWRKKLLENIHTCQNCGFDNKKILVIHHKDKNKKNNSLDNLLVLCPNCHAIIHYG